MRIGILALQGAFIEHSRKLYELDADCFEIRQARHAASSLDGLILPGGESTVIGKLLHELNLFEPLRALINDGLPVFGTCAGLILLADTIVNDNSRWLATMDIAARRNAYGRQLGSFHTEALFDGLGVIPMTFIRAPYIESVWGGATPLSSVDGKIVAARQHNQLVTAFHPELDDDLSVHSYFISMIKSTMRGVRAGNHIGSQYAPDNAG